MKVTKYNHSCLLIEDTERNTLIDPGKYSENVLIPERLPKLDYLIITHDHMDHFSMPLVKKIATLFPNINIITTTSIVEQLINEHVEATTEGDEYITVQEVPHERNWGITPPKNILVTVGGLITHPGDSHTFDTTTDVLALPITAPWGSTTAAVDLAQKLKPNVIIPIHDYMLKDDSRKTLYEWLEAFLQPQGIKLMKVESGQPFEV